MTPNVNTNYDQMFPLTLQTLSGYGGVIVEQRGSNYQNTNYWPSRCLTLQVVNFTWDGFHKQLPKFTEQKIAFLPIYAFNRSNGKEDNMKFDWTIHTSVCTMHIIDRWVYSLDRTFTEINVVISGGLWKWVKFKSIP